MELNSIEFFTFDEILGVEKCFAKRRTILDCVKAFDEANKKLYKQIVKLQKENSTLKEKLKGNK